MSTTPIRTAEALATEIVRRVSLCTVAQGAETDLAAQVFDGRRHVDDSMVPCATVIEGTDTPKQAVAGTAVDNTQQFVVFAYVKCDPRHPNLAARAAIRDLKRALFTTGGRPDANWGRSVRAVRYLGKDIGPRADGASFVVAAVELEVEFVEDLSAP